MIYLVRFFVVIVFYVDQKVCFKDLKKDENKQGRRYRGRCDPTPPPHHLDVFQGLYLPPSSMPSYISPFWRDRTALDFVSIIVTTILFNKNEYYIKIMFELNLTEFEQKFRS